MSSTTLKDHGRHSSKHGDIPFYYAFPLKFWFRKHMISPDDVYTWCRDNCEGYYKVISYTHEDSVRKKYARGNEYDHKIIYVDKIYLSDENDAMQIKMAFDVSEEQIVRTAKMKRKMKPRKKK